LKGVQQILAETKTPRETGAFFLRNIRKAMRLSKNTAIYPGLTAFGFHLRIVEAVT
jgi:hypothetical protein